MFNFDKIHETKQPQSVQEIKETNSPEIINTYDMLISAPSQYIINGNIDSDHEYL